MLEKIKDFIYDMSDVFISLLIITLLVLAVTWKINDTFQIRFTENDVVVGTTSPTAEPNSQSGTDSVLAGSQSEHSASEASTGNESTASTATETSETPEASVAPTTSLTPPAATATTKPAPPTTAKATSPAVSDNPVKFTVAAGSSGLTIAKKLKEEGFIDNVDSFIHRAVELKLDNKLLTGTFSLKKSYDYDTILKILTGTN